MAEDNDTELFNSDTNSNNFLPPYAFSSTEDHVKMLSKKKFRTEEAGYLKILKSIITTQISPQHPLGPGCNRCTNERCGLFCFTNILNSDDISNKL